jgi:transposase InsO family protein
MFSDFGNGHRLALYRARKAAALSADRYPIACQVTDECLNETQFVTLGDARETLVEWQEDDNWHRPHSALANLTPMEFLQRKTMDKMAA